MTFLRLFPVLIFLAAGIAACAAPTMGSTGKVLQSNVQRQASPDISADDLQELATGNAAFALDFYQAVGGEDGNLFFSPNSLSLALAMTYAGARGETEAQMAQTLGFSLPQDRLHPAFNALDQKLAIQQPSDPEQPQPFLLSIANSLWGQQDYDFLPEFLDLLALNYGAGLRLLDFETAPEPSRKTINEWVLQETHDKIEDLIPEGAIDEMTRLVLANAIYFKADWLYPFEPNATRQEPFNLLDGSQVQAQMMSFKHPTQIPYLAGEDYQAIVLPYVGDTVSMLVLVPEAGSFSEFEAGLDADRLNTIVADLQPRMVALSLPKFSFESEYSLKDTLAAMGMPAAFDPGLADFSGMDGTRSLYIGNVFHKAFVAVDEKGTEAAAATAVVIELAAAPLGPEVVLDVDRPFIFFIRHNPTGAILFAGRLLDPSP
jgi:serpin B